MSRSVEVMEIRLRVGLPLNSGWRQIRTLIISNECGGPARAVRERTRGAARVQGIGYREAILMISGSGIRSRTHESWLWMLSGAGKPSPYARLGAIFFRADSAPSPGRDRIHRCRAP